MTCIAGASRAGKVWLGGDSFAGSHDGNTLTTDPKVWKSGGMLLGGCGDFRALDLARRIDCPAVPDESWVRYGFTSAMLRLSRELDGADRRPDFEMLLGALGCLWLVLEDFAVLRLGSYGACGSGEAVALGAMHARPNAHPRERVRSALHAAEKHCPTVSGPFTLVSL